MPDECPDSFKPAVIGTAINIYIKIAPIVTNTFANLLIFYDYFYLPFSTVKEVNKH